MLSTQTLCWGIFLPAVVQATSYGLVKEYVGSTFFDDWNFYGNCALLLLSLQSYRPPAFGKDSGRGIEPVLLSWTHLHAACFCLYIYTTVVIG